MASGELDFEILPRIGETVSFADAPRVPRAPLPKIDAFSFQLRVTDVIHAPAGGSYSTMVLLEPAVLQSNAQAIAFVEYLQGGFGLGVDPF